MIQLESTIRSRDMFSDITRQSILGSDCMTLNIVNFALKMLEEPLKTLEDPLMTA